MLIPEILDRSVRCGPETEAIVDQDRRYTYKELGERVNRFTNVLLDVGVRKGDRVALLAKNSFEYIVSYFGIWRAGAVAVPINFRFVGGEVEFIINQSDAKYLLFSREFLDLIQGIRPELKKVVYFIAMESDEVPEGMLNYDKLMEQASSRKPEVDISENDVAAQMYTSGTTGFPKGAMTTHRNWTSGLFLGVVSMCVSHESRVLAVPPLFHIAGAGLVLTNVLVGATTVIERQFDPVRILKLIGDERITIMLFVPSMLKILLAVPGVEKYDFSSLQLLVFGAEPMNRELLLSCRRVFQCDLQNSFAQTEAVSLFTAMTADEYRNIARDPGSQYKLNAVGKEFPGVHIRIVDEEDQDVAEGDTGEIIVHSDNIMTGYYGMPEETASALRGGWLHTGDIGRFDKDRYLYIVDRKKDMIISGGENVATPEVEKVILQLEGVADVAVVGIPHEKWGEVPKAFVIKSPDSDLKENDVIDFCMEHLAKFKCPKAVEFISALPRNATGKVLKRELRR